jgi:hypothetical protein
MDKLQNEKVRSWIETNNTVMRFEALSGDYEDCCTRCKACNYAIFSIL